MIASELFDVTFFGRMQHFEIELFYGILKHLQLGRLISATFCKQCNNKQQFFAAFVLCSLFMGYSQTNLFDGDIAIIGIDTSSEDFMFVTFVPLSAGTQIYFTDEEFTKYCNEVVGAKPSQYD